MIKGSLIALVTGLSLILAAPGANAAEQMTGSMGRAFNVNEMIGVSVKNLRGEELGRISDLVVDSEGKVALFVLSHGGFWGFNEKRTAIPFEELRYDQTVNRLTLDISKEKLALAPPFKMGELVDQKKAENIYKYFGQQPYWSGEEGIFRGVNEPLEEERPPIPYIEP